MGYDYNSYLDCLNEYGLKEELENTKALYEKNKCEV
jgi:hypothetical protein